MKPRNSPTDAEVGAVTAAAMHKHVYGERGRPTEDRIVDTILLDMTDRKGLRQEWSRIDEDVKKEIRDTWIQIVRDAMRMCPSCGRASLGTMLCGVCDNDD